MMGISNRDELGLAYWLFFMLLPSINYVLFPTVQILTSADLRQHVFSVGEVSLKCCACACDCVDMDKEADCRSKRQSVSAAIAEAAEMTAMPLTPRPAVV